MTVNREASEVVLEVAVQLAENNTYPPSVLIYLAFNSHESWDLTACIIRDHCTITLGISTSSPLWCIVFQATSFFIFSKATTASSGGSKFTTRYESPAPRVSPTPRTGTGGIRIVSAMNEENFMERQRWETDAAVV